MTRATEPFYSKARATQSDEGGWIVGLIRDEKNAPDDPFVHGHCTFDTQDEAEAFVAKTNGVMA
jgi:hypothetical protein